jgi:hypothetical protein
MRLLQSGLVHVSYRTALRWVCDKEFIALHWRVWLARSLLTGRSNEEQDLHTPQILSHCCVGDRLFTPLHQFVPRWETQSCSLECSVSCAYV